MPDPDPNLAASVRARLLNRARATGRPFDILLTQFVHERLLYRLSVSPHADRFALKGAMLLATWLPDTARGPRDLDLLGFGEARGRRLGLAGHWTARASYPAPPAPWDLRWRPESISHRLGRA